MRKQFTIRIAMALTMALLAGGVYAGQIFQQDFTSSTTVSDYLDGGSASGGQFDSITISDEPVLPNVSVITDSITNNELTFDIATPDVTHIWGQAFVTTTALTGAPDVASMQVAMTMTGDDTNGSNYRARVGFVSDAAEAGGLRNLVSIFVRTAGTVTFNSSNGLLLTPTVATGTEFTLTIYDNNSGISQAFTAVDGNSYTIGNDKTYVFIDSVLGFDSATYTDGLSIAKDGAIAYGRLVANGDNAARNYDDGIVSFDGITIRDDLAMPVPEPVTLGLLGLGGLAILRRRSRKA